MGFITMKDHHLGEDFLDLFCKHQTVANPRKPTLSIHLLFLKGLKNSRIFTEENWSISPYPGGGGVIALAIRLKEKKSCTT